MTGFKWLLHCALRFKFIKIILDKFLKHALQSTRSLYGRATPIDVLSRFLAKKKHPADDWNYFRPNFSSCIVHMAQIHFNSYQSLMPLNTMVYSRSLSCCRSRYALYSFILRDTVGCSICGTYFRIALIMLCMKRELQNLSIGPRPVAWTLIGYCQCVLVSCNRTSTG